MAVVCIFAIVDPGSDTTGHLEAELCGIVEPSTYCIIDVAHIVFHTDTDTVSLGFRIKYSSNPGKQNIFNHNNFLWLTFSTTNTTIIQKQFGTFRNPYC